MDDCCIDKGCAIAQLRQRQAVTLRIVLVVNAAMFVVELVAGSYAGSIALLADSLDMLGDALVYGFSLYVVGRGALWKARAAAAKAELMGLFGFFVFAQLVYKLFNLELPTAETMGAVGALALASNGVCFALLWRHRGEDINMRSVWLCSRAQKPTADNRSKMVARRSMQALAVMCMLCSPLVAQAVPVLQRISPLPKIHLRQ